MDDNVTLMTFCLNSNDFTLQVGVKIHKDKVISNLVFKI